MSDLDFSTCDNKEEQFVLNLINEHKQRLNEITLNYKVKFYNQKLKK